MYAKSRLASNECFPWPRVDLSALNGRLKLQGGALSLPVFSVLSTGGNRCTYICNPESVRSTISFGVGGLTSANMYSGSQSAISSLISSGIGADLYLEWINNSLTDGKYLVFRNHASTMGSTSYYEWYFRRLTSKNSANTTSWQTTSDQRVKENIKKANLKLCYKNVKELNLYKYKYIDGFGGGTEHDMNQLGFIAQEVSKKYKNSVQRGSVKIKDRREIPDLMTLDVSQINMTTFGAVKRLIRIVERQNKRIKKLEEQLGIIDDETDDDDADEPYVKEYCDECDIDCLTPEPDKPN